MPLADFKQCLKAFGLKIPHSVSPPLIYANPLSFMQDLNQFLTKVAA